jgi:photosystem II stability/assembly factor-like uncharacterized protein
VTWTECASPSTFTLFDVTIVAADDAWAVGYSGILHWNGVTWTTIFPNVTLYAVTTVADTGWAVGRNNETGTIMVRERTAWSSQRSPTGQALFAVADVSPREAWAVGASGVILHYLEEPAAVKVDEFLAVAENNSHALICAGLAFGAILTVGVAGPWMRRRWLRGT